MRFKRTADPVSYAVLWWFGFFVCNSGLLAFALYKFTFLDTYEYYVQTKEEAPAIVNLPDIMVCTRMANVQLLYTDSAPNLTLTTYNITKEQMAASPCNNQDQVTIITMRNQTVNVTSHPSYSFSITLRNQSYAYETARVIAMPNFANEYEWNKGFSLSGNRYIYEMEPNRYNPTQFGTFLTLRLTNVKTTLVNRGFMGLFELNKATKYTVISKGFSIETSGQTTVLVTTPRTNINQSQRLITTIPNAITSWGGAFSTTWGLFHSLFGASQLNPFGLITLYFIGRKTRRRIADKYGTWRREKMDEESENQHGLSRTMGSMRSRERPPTFYPDLRPDNFGASSMPRDDVGSYPGLGLNDASYNPLLYNEDSDYRWKMQQYYHNRTIESKIRELEELLMEYYLDMELIDTKDPGVSEITHNKPWRRKPTFSLPKRSQGHLFAPTPDTEPHEYQETYPMMSTEHQIQEIYPMVPMSHQGRQEVYPITSTGHQRGQELLPVLPMSHQGKQEFYPTMHAEHQSRQDTNPTLHLEHQRRQETDSIAEHQKRYDINNDET